MKHQLPILIALLLTGVIVVNAQEIRLDTLTVGEYGRTYRSGTTHDLVYRFIYPVGDNPVAKNIRDDLTKNFFDTKSAVSLDEAQAEYRCGIDAHLKGGEQGEHPAYTYLTKESSARIVNNNVFELITHENGSWAGVHGWDLVMYYNYDLINGCRITTDDLFREPAKAEIIALIMQTPDSFGRIRECPIEELTDNFLILHRGLIFFYNQYEIGPYVANYFKYTLKYSDFKHLLRPSALRYFNE